MSRVKITDMNEPLDAGDMIELHFNSTGMFWLQASQIALIEWKLSGDKRFRIRSWKIHEPSTVVFTVEVLRTNPVLVTVSVIALAIIGVGIVFKMTLDSAYKIVNVLPEALQEPIIKVIAVGIILAVLGGVGLKIFKK